MIPKEKAKELVEIMSMGQELNGSVEFMELYPVPKNKYAKECALKAVDEILFALNSVTDKYIELGMRTIYQEVKQEIEKL
jgi:hypothetical protein